MNVSRYLHVIGLVLGLIGTEVATSATSVAEASSSDSQNSQTEQPLGRAPLAPVSVAVPAGNSCILHPEGNPDPRQSVSVKADADGVARFQAVRPAPANSVDRLTLDCTDPDGNYHTYSVDLRSEATFEPRPFDPSRTGLSFRPALTGDPLSFTPQELIQAGYGLRPDPTVNPDGYRRWLTAVSTPAYKLRSAGQITSTPRTSRPLASVEEDPDTGPQPVGPAPESDGTLTLAGSNFANWTGAVLGGSYHMNATSAQTYSYLVNEASFVVPTVYPGGLGTRATQMSIWNGPGSCKASPS